MTRTHPHHPRFPRNNLFRHSISFSFSFFYCPLYRNALVICLSVYTSISSIILRVRRGIYIVLCKFAIEAPQRRTHSARKVQSAVCFGVNYALVSLARVGRGSARCVSCVCFGRGGAKKCITRGARLHSSQLRLLYKYRLRFSAGTLRVIVSSAFSLFPLAM